MNLIDSIGILSKIEILYANFLLLLLIGGEEVNSNETFIDIYIIEIFSHFFIYVADTLSSDESNVNLFAEKIDTS